MKAVAWHKKTVASHGAKKEGCRRKYECGTTPAGEDSRRVRHIDQGDWKKPTSSILDLFLIKTKKNSESRFTLFEAVKRKSLAGRRTLLERVGGRESQSSAEEHEEEARVGQERQ